MSQNSKIETQDYAALSPSDAAQDATGCASSKELLDKVIAERSRMTAQPVGKAREA